MQIIHKILNINIIHNWITICIVGTIIEPHTKNIKNYTYINYNLYSSSSLLVQNMYVIYKVINKFGIQNNYERIIQT